MNSRLAEILKKKAFNSWRLFVLISGPVSVIMVIAIATTDLTTGEGVSSLIQLSVRFAVPLLYVVFAASSLQIIFSSVITRWLLRNRKFIGLCFAAAMGWQLLFILWLVTVHSDYYLDEVYVLRDAIEGVVGYLLLIAMTLTSFRFGRRHLTPGQWRLLHKGGIYFLWAYAFSVYWWNLFYYPNPALLDYIYYWTGLSAWALRAGAWYKKRHQSADVVEGRGILSSGLMSTGIAIGGIGLLAAGFGSAWRMTAEELLTGYAITRLPELYLPYWPFEPFLPLFFIALGTFLASKYALQLH